MPKNSPGMKPNDDRRMRRARLVRDGMSWRAACLKAGYSLSVANKGPRGYMGIDDLIPCKPRGEKRPVFRQFLVDEFDLPTVFKRFDPLFVSHVRSLDLQYFNDRRDLFRLWTPRSWVLDTNVGSKFFLTLGFILLFHFIKRITSERTSRLKLPVTFGATEALKLMLLNPYQLARHGRSIRP
jgi:hypothetical protein